MRFLIHELPYERPLAAGRFRYQQDGRPTGVLENWRLTAAAEGYRFLRVDWDGRDGPAADSALYHLTLNPAGRPERLKYRYFGPAMEVVGDVLLDDGMVTASRVVNGRRFEEEIILERKWMPSNGDNNFPNDYAFWFPSALGLSLLAWVFVPERQPFTRPGITVIFPGSTNGAAAADAFRLQVVDIMLKYEDDQEVIVGRTLLPEVWPLRVEWSNRRQLILLDDWRLPVRVQNSDLTAVETRYIRYETAGRSNSGRASGRDIVT